MHKSILISAAFAAMTLAPLAHADFDGPAPLAWRWVQPTSANVKGSPVVTNDSVYVAVGNRIFCLDKVSGNHKWRYPQIEPIDGNFLSQPVVMGDLLLASADNRKLYAIDMATGKEKWRYAAPQPILGNPVVAGKYVVIAQTNNSLMAIDPASSTLAIDFTLPSKSGVSASTAVCGDRW